MRRLAPLLLLAACKPVETLPDDVDGVFHWLWDHHDEGLSADLADGVTHLDAALGGASLVAPTDGTISRLTADEVIPIGVTDRDPAKAAGIFLGNRIDCGPQKVAEIFTHPDQDVLYPGVYDDFLRTYHGDRDAWLAGDIDTLEWSLDYTTSVLGSAYTAHTEATLRRVRPDPSADAPFEQAYLVRFVAPEPAVFDGDSGKSFDQDYQFEVYWSRSDGETLHAYAMWREANWGLGFTSEDEGVQRLLLNNMAGWDADTETICADGGP